MTNPGSVDPGTAEPQLGRNSPTPESCSSHAHRGWYNRGYLPHVDFPGLQMVTYRLADSLPDEILDRVSDELRSIPIRRQETDKRRRLEQWLDAGQGCCVLRQKAAGECVVETWQRFAGERYDLIAWVVMPNHVHVLIRLYEGVPLGKIVQSWKSYTGRRIAGLRAELGLGGPRRGGPGGGAVWMRDYWDRHIRDEKHFRAAVEYIHGNPVKAGLVSNAEDWPWSSAPIWGGVPGNGP